MRRAKLMEAAGLMLVLGSSGWEIFVADWFTAERDENRFIGLAEQNLVNFGLLTDIRNGTRQSDEDIDYFFRAHEWVTNSEIPGAAVVNTVTVTLFLIGSALIVVSKLLEANAEPRS